MITCEKPDQLEALGNIQFKNRTRLDLPERHERIAIIDHVKAESQTSDSREISKYL